MVQPIVVEPFAGPRSILGYREWVKLMIRRLLGDGLLFVLASGEEKIEPQRAAEDTERGRGR